VSGPIDPPATLLVPGWSDTSRALRRAESHLVEAGWPRTHVACVDFARRYGSNMEHAAEIEAALERLRERSGSRRVAVVAHSMGGLALRYHLTVGGGGTSVHTAIFLGTPHRGTVLAWLAWGRGGVEMRPGSELLRRLAAQPLPPGVRSICIRTPIDLRVVPWSSALLDGAECHTVRLPTHAGMLRHAGTLRLVADLLLHGRVAGAA
jgi:pimeloyl-ACP methyl ester carboxylesterase